jgi:hypothetical protein
MKIKNKSKVISQERQNKILDVFLDSFRELIYNNKNITIILPTNIIK